nr:hypothetical protein Iba_chr02bCG11300 [Ipomoea batatas]
MYYLPGSGAYGWSGEPDSSGNSPLRFSSVADRRSSLAAVSNAPFIPWFSRRLWPDSGVKTSRLAMAAMTASVNPFGNSMKKDGLEAMDRVSIEGKPACLSSPLFSGGASDMAVTMGFLDMEDGFVFCCWRSITEETSCAWVGRTSTS